MRKGLLLLFLLLTCVLVDVQNKILFVAADTINDTYKIAHTSVYSIDLCTAGTPTGIETISFRNDLKIYPNPAKHQLNLQVSYPIEKLEIWSANGTLVMKKVTPEKQIDISHLKDGFYLIIAQTAKQLLTGKVLVSR